MEQLRYSGIAGVVVLWTCFGAGMALAGLSFLDDRPLSYMGTDPRSEILFTSAMLVAAVLFTGFYFFVYAWYSSSVTFLAVGLIGLAGQVVAGIVPLSGGGTSHTIHTTGGIIVGLSLPLLMWRFAASQPKGSWRRQSYGLVWLEVVACIVGVMLSRAMYAPIAEIAPGSVYHLWIIIVTVRSLKAQPKAMTRWSTARAACT